MREELFEVYIDSLKYYTEGKVGGEWITFPLDEQSLTDQLRDWVGVTSQNPESIICDTNIPPILNFLRPVIGEYTNPYDLNMIAHLLDKAEVDYNALDLYLQTNPADSLMELGNLILKCDEIPYRAYESSEITERMNKSEKFGRTYAKVNGFLNIFKEHNIESYIDYARYGEDVAIDEGVTLSDAGYLLDRSVESNEYSLEDLYRETGLDVKRRVFAMEEKQTEKAVAMEKQKKWVPKL